MLSEDSPPESITDLEDKEPIKRTKLNGIEREKTETTEPWIGNCLARVHFSGSMGRMAENAGHDQETGDRLCQEVGFADALGLEEAGFRSEQVAGSVDI